MKCNHLGYGIELCKECNSPIKCGNCGDKLKYSFWADKFEDKLRILIELEKALKQKEQILINKEKEIKLLVDKLK